MQRSLSFSEAIDSFVLYPATEKGLSVNYQLSNRRSLQELVAWFRSRGLLDPGASRPRISALEALPKVAVDFYIKGISSPMLILPRGLTITHPV